jgi:hypothetical protein
MIRYIPVLMLLACSVASAAETRATIPKQFVGFWGSNLKSCQDADGEGRAIHIEPQRIRFYESTGKVLAVATKGELELALILELRGEGGTWIESLQYRLSADKSKMTDVTGRQNRMVLVRCDKLNQK